MIIHDSSLRDEAATIEGLRPFLDRMALHAEDEKALIRAAGSVRTFPKSESLVRQGRAVQELLVLSKGIVRAVRTLSDGKQQIVALYVPGDVMGCVPPGEHVWWTDLTALTAGSLVPLRSERAAELLSQKPAIMAGLWRETTRQAAIQQEWMVCLGRQKAYERLAHFLCEINLRFTMAGLARAPSFDFPMTQGEMADALGLSVVHVNRVLQHLRRDGLVVLDRGTLLIRDWNGLARAADFNPAYLKSVALSS